MNSERTYKLQNEIKEIYEIKKTSQDIKEDFNKDMDNLTTKELKRNPGNKTFL
jgi:hypothetical protein